MKQTAVFEVTKPFGANRAHISFLCWRARFRKAVMMSSSLFRRHKGEEAEKTNLAFSI